MPTRLLPLAVLVALGCGRAAPSPAVVTPSATASGKYANRSDLMLVKLPEASLTRWPSNGFPPLWSARNPAATPDRDLAVALRKGLGTSILDPADRESLSSTQLEQLSLFLEAQFGTPAQPLVRTPDWNEITIAAVVRPKPNNGVFRNLGDAASAIRKWSPEERGAVETDWRTAIAAKSELKLDDASLARGATLYRRWCLQCHGPTGAGDGAHAIELAAMPRDYRQGIFKFVTSDPKTAPKQAKKGRGTKGKPLRIDLVRTVRKGIDGSMMPAFSTLSEQEIEDIVSYVIHLSVRGETEFATLATLLDPNSDDFGTSGLALSWLVDQYLLAVLYNWQHASRHPIPIPKENVQTDEDRLLSAFRGFKHYAAFGCEACHQKFGREPQLKWDLWGGVVQPRNLVLGVYRGGREGKDLYARLYGGIYPSGMTEFHDKLATGPSHHDRPDNLWNVVHFLQALSDPYARQQLQNPAILAKFKDRLRADNDLFLDDLNSVKLDP